jgi:hypothetical protein
MTSTIAIGKNTAALIIFFGIAVVVGIILACTPPQIIKIPVSTWGDNYFYEYEPPETKTPASVRVTLAIVNPDFSQRASFDLIYDKVAKGLSRSIAIDLDKIIIAKGMTITGPFESLDMMTYPDKKNADLSLTPEFLINTQTRDISYWQRHSQGFVKSVEVKVDGWIALILREPLSSEKIWIKKIGVGEAAERTEIYADLQDMGIKPGYNYVHEFGPGSIVYDGRKDALANIIKKMYPKIMNTAWNYLNTEELLILKEKAQEVRKLKRY